MTEGIDVGGNPRYTCDSVNQLTGTADYDDLHLDCAYDALGNVSTMTVPAGNQFDGGMTK